MPPDRRLLREIRSAYEGMKRYQIEAGQWVNWFRFDAAGTTSDPVYGTGPQRKWHYPIIIPAMIGEYHRAPQNFDDDGLYRIDRVHLIMSYFAFFSSTMADPDPTGQDHVNDRVAFDGHLFSVDSFTPQGHVGSYFLTISCDVAQVAQEEMQEDVPVKMFAPYITAGPGVFNVTAGAADTGVSGGDQSQ